jgi:hypothetical protein
VKLVKSESGGGAIGESSAANAPGQRPWKRRSHRELGNRFAIRTFPQQQQRVFGYVSKGANVVASWAMARVWARELKLPLELCGGASFGQFVRERGNYVAQLDSADPLKSFVFRSGPIGKENANSLGGVPNVHIGNTGVTEWAVWCQ